MAVVVKNWREVNRAFAQTDKDTKKAWTRDRKAIAEPVRQEAENLAAGGIRNIGPRWAQMRTGVTQKVVYVAPKQRGVGRGNPRSRPNLAPQLARKALEPALERHSRDVEQALERLLDTVCARFNGGF